MKIKYYFTATILCALSLQAHSAVAETICPKPSDNKFHFDGHGLTTAVVGALAGLEPLEARRLAYFSQAPDEVILKYSAPSVYLWGWLPFNWLHAGRIFKILHSLHGGNNTDVALRQKDLSMLITKYNRAEDDWKTGFLIHAYGDSFAHTYIKNGQRVAYSAPFGHGLDRTVKPDEIHRHLITYQKYATALYKSLETPKAHKKSFDTFIKGVGKALDTSTNPEQKESAVEKYLREFEFSDVKPDHLKLSEEECATWKRELKSYKVRRFLRDIEPHF